MTTTAAIHSAERFVVVFRAAAVARKSTGLGERPIIEGVHLSYDAAADELTVKGTNSFVLFEGTIAAGGDNNFAVTLTADVAKAIAADKTLAKASKVVIDVGPEADAMPNVMISVDRAPRWVCADAGAYPRTASLWPPTTGEVAEVVGLAPKHLMTITRMATALDSEYLTLRNGGDGLKPVTVGFSGVHGSGCRALIMPVKRT